MAAHRALKHAFRKYYAKSHERKSERAGIVDCEKERTASVSPAWASASSTLHSIQATRDQVLNTAVTPVLPDVLPCPLQLAHDRTFGQPVEVQMGETACASARGHRRMGKPAALYERDWKSGEKREIVNEV